MSTLIVDQISIIITCVKCHVVIYTLNAKFNVAQFLIYKFLSFHNYT